MQIKSMFRAGRECYVSIVYVLFGGGSGGEERMEERMGWCHQGKYNSRFEKVWPEHLSCPLDYKFSRPTMLLHLLFSPGLLREKKVFPGFALFCLA